MRSSSRPLSGAGSAAFCPFWGRRSCLSTARPAAARAESTPPRCTWFRRLRPGRDWCWGNGPRRRSPTRSRPFPNCSRRWPWRVAPSPSTPWVHKPPSPRPFRIAAPTTSWRSRTTSPNWPRRCRTFGAAFALTPQPTPRTALPKPWTKTMAAWRPAAATSIDLVEKIVRKEQIECNFARSGHLEVACKQSHFDTYARSVELIAREFHHQLRIVPRSDLREEIGSGIYYGGIVDDESAGLNPALYVAGLAKAALRAGACVYEQARVESIARTSDSGETGFELLTSRGRVFAKEVFVATSGYTSETTPGLQKKIIPIGSFIIVTERLPETLARELSPRNRMIFDSKHYLYYYRLTPDNRMLFGGRAAFFPETGGTVRKSAEILRRGMIRVYPQLRGTRVDYVWGGTLDFAMDVMPHSGRIDGMHFALGFAGHGVAAATWMGAKLAGVLCGDPDDNPFSRIPFPGAPLGLRSGHTWALPLAGAYYKVLDWLT